MRWLLNRENIEYLREAASQGKGLKGIRHVSQMQVGILVEARQGIEAYVTIMRFIDALEPNYSGMTMDSSDTNKWTLIGEKSYLARCL